ncbi:Hypothetical protein ABZS17I87_01383 [Kosakonia cowanii]
MYLEHRQPSSVVITLFLCQSAPVGSLKSSKKNVNNFIG